MSSHVLVLLENEGYPHDRKVRQQAEAIVADGYRVTVVCPTGYGHDAPAETMAGVRVIRYQLPTEGGGVLGYAREYALSLARIYRRASKVAAQDPPRVVIACSPPDLLVGVARRIARGSGAVLFDHHDLSPELFERKFGRTGPLHRLLLTIERAAYGAADVVLEPNDTYADIARARGRVSADRLFVVRHGADTDVFFPVPQRPELRRGFDRMVLWMGNMTATDRVRPLLQAAELMRDHGRRDTGFTMLGSGEARAEIQAEVRQRRLTEIVELPGPAYGDLLRGYLATADVCVSVDVRNAMNDASTVTKVVDYMTMARPVVQFPLPEMSRLCGDTTIYAEHGDVVDLACKIEALLDDRRRADALGAAARGRVLELLDWSRQVPVLLQAVRCGEQAAQRSDLERSMVARTH